MWCYPISDSADPIIGNRGGSPINFAKLHTSQFQYDGTASSADISYNLTLNTWQNVCIVKDMDGGGFARIQYYHNTTLVGSSYPDFVMDPNPFYIGGDGPANECANTRVGSVQIYNRPLTQAEIVTNYNALSSRYI